MKKLYSCLIVLTFFICFANSLILVSCDSNSDTNLNEVIDAKQDANSLYAYRSAAKMPYNSDNPFDYAGRIHNEILEAYYQQESIPTNLMDIADRIEILAAYNKDFVSIRKPFYEAASIERAQYIINNKYSCLPEIISGSNLTLYGKVSLEAFINSSLELTRTNEDYEVIYDFIVTYESEVVSNSRLTEEDKQTILITSSILRHSASLAKKKPKKNTDPAWDKLICNIYGTAEDANKGVAEAITMGLICGIAEN